MFSRRTQWSLGHNPLTQTLERLKHEGADIIDLTESNPTRCGFDYPASLYQALSDPKHLKYEPASCGIVSARQAIAQYYSKAGFAVHADDCILTASTSEGYSYVLKLLTDAGDRVLIPSPSYPLFQFLLELNDVESVFYPLVYRQGVWAIDFKALEQMIDARVKAIILVNPNNPTGSYIKEDELRQLNAICARHGIAIISDEVFWDYARTDDAKRRSLLNNDEVLTFVLGGLSKTLATPQMKLSWIIQSGPKAIKEQAFQRLEIIADTFLSVNTPVQNSVGQWMQQREVIQKQIQERVAQNHLFLMQAIKGIAPLLSVEGGWYDIVQTDHDEEALIDALLNEAHVLVHPGFFFDFEDNGHVILSLIVPQERFQNGVKRLINHLSKLKSMS